MNCAVHNDRAATAYCRTCGKPLCDECKRDVRGVIYCEECIARRLQDTVPAGVPVAGIAPGAPAPGMHPQDTAGTNAVFATLLGFIPGVGAVYNGQFVKAVVHVLIFAMLIWASGHAGSWDFLFGISIAFFYFYMVIDAYKTARAKELGQPLPDMLGIERLFSVDAPNPPRPATPPASNTVAPDATDPGAPPAPGTYSAGTAPVRPPSGAVVLIVLGILFLLGNMGWIRAHWFEQFWPVILIAWGVYALMRRWNRIGC